MPSKTATMSEARLQSDDASTPLLSASAVDIDASAVQMIPVTAPSPGRRMQMVQITAPANLAEGFRFQANVGRRVIDVVVPEGGVNQGQTFLVAIPEDEDSDTVENELVIPKGWWKDDICGFFHHGCCHPSLCCSLFCHSIHISQIMTRMKLNLCARPGSAEQTRSTCKNFTCLLIGTIVSMWMFRAWALDALLRNHQQDHSWAMALYYVIGGVWWLYVLSLVTKTRGYIRNKYDIPGTCVGDCCCAYWCMCCTVAQMSRHTGDYKRHRAACCSSTGLARDAPEIV